MLVLPTNSSALRELSKLEAKIKLRSMNTRLSRRGHSDKHKKIHFSADNRALGLSHGCGLKVPDMKNFTPDLQREAQEPKTQVGLWDTSLFPCTTNQSLLYEVLKYSEHRDWRWSVVLVPDATSNSFLLLVLAPSPAQHHIFIMSVTLLLFWILVPAYTREPDKSKLQANFGAPS